MVSGAKTDGSEGHGARSQKSESIKAISVEQLAGVFEASEQTLAVVAGGWVAGRISHWPRPCGGAVKWIAERLQMGAPGYVNHLLYRRRKAGRK